MFYQRQRGFATSLLVTSLILVLMSLGGGWDRAYGQGSTVPGPPPPPPAGPVGGAEGDTAEAPPARRTAVASESGELPAGAVAEESGELPAGVAVVTVDAGAAQLPVSGHGLVGESANVAVATQLDAAGGATGLQWPLLFAGVVFFVMGASIFMRTRKTR